MSAVHDSSPFEPISLDSYHGSFRKQRRPERATELRCPFRARSTGPDAPQSGPHVRGGLAIPSARLFHLLLAPSVRYLCHRREFASETWNHRTESPPRFDLRARVDKHFA